MSFSWSETLTPQSTLPKASHVTELRSNADTVRGKVGLSGFAWTGTPTQYSNTLLASTFLEVRTAMDQAEDANTCSTQHSAEYSSNDSEECTEILSTNNRSVETNVRSSAKMAEYLETFAPNYITADVALKSGVNASN